MDKALLSRVEKQALYHRYPRSLPIAVLCLGLVITCLFVLNVERTDRLAKQAALAVEATSLATELEQKAAENIAYLTAAASLFKVSNEVSGDEFARFIADMSAGHSTRGALGIGWIRWITPAEIPAIEAKQAEQYPEIAFKVRPVPPRSNARMAVIELLEPRNIANQQAPGFDMYSEPVRRAAMDDALASGKPIASGKVHLIQDRGNPDSAGTIIFIAVYGGDQGINSISRTPKGFVYTPVRVADFFKNAAVSAHSGTSRAALYDGAVRPQNFLAGTEEPLSDAMDAVRVHVNFANRRWILLVGSPPSPLISRTSLLILVLGGAVSALLALLVRMATARAAEDRRVLEWLSSQSDIRNSLTRELNHRVKNTLANVLSIVSLTRRRSTNIDSFADSLTGRIRALSATHDLLSQREWRNAPVLDVVTSELAPYMDPEDPHAEVSGPDALLAPNDAMSLGLALHELATNAAKYGALSVPQGRVSVTWSLPEANRCQVQWREEGGPPVVTPTRRGFGLDLIEKIVSSELKSPVTMAFEETGVSCTLSVPIRDLGEFKLRSS